MKKELNSLYRVTVKCALVTLDFLKTCQGPIRSKLLCFNRTALGHYQPAQSHSQKCGDTILDGIASLNLCAELTNRFSPVGSEGRKCLELLFAGGISEMKAGLHPQVQAWSWVGQRSRAQAQPMHKDQEVEKAGEVGRGREAPGPACLEGSG